MNTIFINIMAFVGILASIVGMVVLFGVLREWTRRQREAYKHINDSLPHYDQFRKIYGYQFEMLNIAIRTVEKDLHEFKQQYSNDHSNTKEVLG
jgi:hypothetical protein